jgi:hypothetical protein
LLQINDIKGDKMKRRDWIRYVIIGVLALFAPATWLFRKRYQKDLPVQQTRFEVSFEPFDFPHKGINELSLIASLSPDGKFLLVSYSHGTEWQSCLNLGNISTPSNPTFYTITEFRPETFITSLGLSSQNADGLMHTSYTLRSYPPRQPLSRQYNVCDDSLYRIRLKNGKIAENGVALLMPRLGRSFKKKYFLANRRVTPHTWLDSESALLFASYLGIFKYTAQNTFLDMVNKEEPEKYHLEIYRLQDMHNVVSDPLNGNYISSNICDMGNGTVQFIESPHTNSRELKLGKGNLVTIDINGNELSRREFPSLPFGRMILLTKNHWGFCHGIAEQRMVFAPLDQPDQYSLLKFPMEQLRTDEKSNIIYHFKICGLLPDNRTLICTRSVGQRDYEEAKKQGIPLGELGMVKLPMEIT